MTDVLNSTAAQQLKTVIERAERLIQEKTEVNDQLKEVYAEAKGNGFDVKIIKKIIARRKKDRARVQEEESLTDLYLAALGEI
jgi:uncharacterized protein (UPF0335 family)